MEEKQPPTGAELEARGLLKFECMGCRDRFPARCVDHDGRPRPERRTSTARPKPRPPVPGNPPLSFDRNPPRGYWGRYDGVISDIKSTLRTAAE